MGQVLWEGMWLVGFVLVVVMIFHEVYRYLGRDDD